MMRTVKWGVLGTAYIFERDTAEGMRQAENCELYAIAGRSLEKAEAFKEKYGFSKAHGSYEELLRMRRWRQSIFHCQIRCIMNGRSGQSAIWRRR